MVTTPTTPQTRPSLERDLPTHTMDLSILLLVKVVTLSCHVMSCANTQECMQVANVDCGVESTWLVDRLVGWLIESTWSAKRKFRHPLFLSRFERPLSFHGNFAAQ